METTGVIDQFLDTFARYIDSGFGLIHGDVGFLASTLIAIDVTIAFLFYAWGEGDDVIARLVRKTLQVGFFAFLLSNWNGLAKIIYLSFSGIGLKAAGSGSADDLLHPGKIAQIGLDAGKPLLDQASALMGFTSFFANFVQIAVLMLAWAIVLIAFFIIAIQIFVTLIEFKLVTLAGFVLVPFGLFGRTAYLAERVLGNIVSTGVKVLVLAVIIGIGTTIFQQFVISFGGTPPTIEQVASIALASLSLLGLAIFGPGIANGSVTDNLRLRFGTHIVPYVVEVDRLGAARSIAPALDHYQPTDPQIAWHLARFIENVRSRPADAIVLRQNLESAYAFTTEQGAAALNDYARAADPFAHLSDTQIAVDVRNVVRASGDSFRIAWDERRYDHGQLTATTHWTAILTIVVQTPSDEATLSKNPLGLYVHTINWSQNLGE